MRRPAAVLDKPTCALRDGTEIHRALGHLTNAAVCVPLFAHPATVEAMNRVDERAL